MAEELYKEWFVRFRFPGHENVKMVDGIPDGWHYERLGDFATILMGQSPESHYYNSNFQGLPFHQGVGSYGEFYLVDNEYSSKGNKIAAPNSIIFSVRAPVGRINLTLNRIILGRGVAAINARNNKNGFLLWTLKNKFSKEDCIGNGAVFTSVTRKELEKQILIVPSSLILDCFDKIANRLEGGIRRLTLANSVLTQQRDRLLPRMMSGKLEIKLS